MFRACEVLLTGHALVHRQQHLLARSFREREKSAICLARETNPGYCFTMMFLNTLAEALRQAFIQQGLHSILARSESLAVLSASIANSRVTVGNCSRNSSRLSPPSR